MCASRMALTIMLYGMTASTMEVKMATPISNSGGGGADGTTKSSLLMIDGRMLASARLSNDKREKADKTIFELILLKRLLGTE